MLNSTEYRRLMKQMYREPAYPMIVVAKCAAGLAIVLILSLVSLDPGQRKLADRTGAPRAETTSFESQAPEPGHHHKVVDKGRR